MSEVRLYKNNSDKISYWEISVTDANELKVTHARTLDGKATTRLIPVKGKNIGRANETTDTEQAHKELESRVSKQLDKGYVRDIEDANAPAVNSLGFQKPVLAVVYSKVKPDSIDWDNAYAQRKFNGHRCMYKDGQLYSRGGKAINLPHILQAIEDLGMTNLHLDGELYVHGTPLQEIGSLIKRPREESEVIEYCVYDVVDTEKSFRERFIQCENLSGNKAIRIVTTMKVKSHDQLKELHDKWVAEGYEGAMLRHGMIGYQTGKRSSSILKLKDYIETEGVVTGFRVGTPFIAEDGEVFECPVWVVQNPYDSSTYVDMVRTGSKELRHAEFLAAESFVGKTLTFKFFELSEDSIPQQAVGLEWREDV